MKIKLLVGLLLISCFTLSAQEISTRKGHLFLKIGPEYRITPIYQSTEYNSRLLAIDNQNSGFGVNYSLEYFITRDLEIGFTNGFRYALVHMDVYHPENTGIIEPTYRILIDYHFYLDYHFKVFKKNELFVRLGISLLNTNSNYGVKLSHYDNNGEYLGSSYGIENFRYSATNLGLGYKTTKLEGMLGIYTTKQTEYFVGSNSFIVPYIKLNFNLFRF